MKLALLFYQITYILIFQVIAIGWEITNLGQKSGFGETEIVRVPDMRMREEELHRKRRAGNALYLCRCSAKSVDAERLK